MALLNNFKAALDLFKEDHRLNTAYKHITPDQLLELSGSESTEDVFWEAINYRMQNRHVNLRHNTPEEDEIRTIEILNDAQLAYYVGSVYAKAMGVSFESTDADAAAAADVDTNTNTNADAGDKDTIPCGLYQYLIQPSRIHIPLLTGQLKKLDACRHAALFEKFIADQGIRFSQLDTCINKLVQDHDPQNAGTIYAAFEEAFSAIDQEENLKKLLKEYVISHIAEF